MGCSKYQSLFTAYLDGVLSNKERHEIEAHLASCHNCQQILDQLSLIVSKTKELEKKRTSPYFVPRVMKRIREEEARVTTVTNKVRLRLAFTFASITVVVIVGSFSYYHFRSGILKGKNAEGPILHSHTLVVEKVPGVLDTVLGEKARTSDGYLMEVEFTRDDSTIYLLPVYSSKARVMPISY